MIQSYKFEYTKYMEIAFLSGATSKSMHSTFLPEILVCEASTAINIL